MRAVDLFCGAGGFSHGAHLAGLDVVRGFDIDPILTHSFAHNFPSTPLELADVAELTGSDVLRAVEGNVDCVFGGPPCQGFSSIGWRNAEDPRRELLDQFFRLVAEIRPSFFVMENVVGLSQGDNRRALDRALDCVSPHYVVLGPIVLDAADFGAATVRKRLFVLGVDPARCDLPDPNNLPRKASATVRDAIADLSGAVLLDDEPNGYDTWKLGGSSTVSDYAKALRSPDGLFTGNRRTVHTQAVTNRFAALKQGEIDMVGRHPRLDWNSQCPTLRAGTGSDRGSYQSVRPVHPTEPRVITVREAARLQGFPDRHRFHPTVWHSFRMIGNSVSPFVAEAILSMIAAGCESISAGAAPRLQKAG